MPVYNGALYLRQALDSLLAQSYSSFEIFIADNGSTDSTPAICTEYARRDPRIVYHRHATPVHVIENFNSTLRAAKGNYFMWAAHDDLWDPEFIATLTTLLEQNPAAVLAFSHFDNIDALGHPIRQFRTAWGEMFSGPKVRQLCRFALADRNLDQPANYIYGLFRTSALRERHGFEALGSCVYGCDYVTLFHLLTTGEFAVSERILFHYRFGHRDTAGVAGLPHLPAMAKRLRRHSQRYFRFLRENRMMFERCGKYVRRAPLGPAQRGVLQATLTYAEIASVILCTYRSVAADFARPASRISPVAARVESQVE